MRRTHARTHTHIHAHIVAHILPTVKRNRGSFSDPGQRSHIVDRPLLRRQYFAVF